MYILIIERMSGGGEGSKNIIAPRVVDLRFEDEAVILVTLYKWRVLVNICLCASPIDLQRPCK